MKTLQANGQKAAHRNFAEMAVRRQSQPVTDSAGRSRERQRGTVFIQVDDSTVPDELSSPCDVLIDVGSQDSRIIKSLSATMRHDGTLFLQVNLSTARI